MRRAFARRRDPPRVRKLIISGAGSFDDGSSDYLALLHGHGVGLEIRLEYLKDLWTKSIRLKYVTESENRCLLNLVADHVDP